MTQLLPAHVLAALKQLLQDVEADGGILDAYKVAETLRQQFPNDDLSSSVLVELMLQARGGIQVVELSPPGLIVEIILPPDASDESAPELLLGESPFLADKHTQ